MKQARENWRGKIVTLQHVPLFPAGHVDCPYNYTNANEIIAEMRRNDIVLAISGHYHEGFSLINDQGVNFLAAPALCETPFSFLEVDIINGNVTAARHDLRLPEKLNLWDLHVHTQFAYCSENMEVVKSMELARDFGLAGLTFAEHSGHLYFDKHTYWSKACLQGGIETAQKENERMEAYLAALADAGCRPQNTGLEADCCFDGKLLVRRADIGRVRYLLGSVHALPALQKQQPDMGEIRDEFLNLTERLVHSGIHVLAHPFRVFNRAKFEAIDSFFDPMVSLLKEARVAAEINFHTQNPNPEFFRRCLAAGVQLALGSDAHNLYEIGEFTPHLALLRECGFNGDLNDILLNPGLTAS